MWEKIPPSWSRPEQGDWSLWAPGTTLFIYLNSRKGKNYFLQELLQKEEKSFTATVIVDEQRFIYPFYLLLVFSVCYSAEQTFFLPYFSFSFNLKTSSITLRKCNVHFLLVTFYRLSIIYTACHLRVVGATGAEPTWQWAIGGVHPGHVHCVLQGQYPDTSDTCTLHTEMQTGIWTMNLWGLNTAPQTTILIFFF